MTIPRRLLLLLLWLLALVQPGSAHASLPHGGVTLSPPLLQLSSHLDQDDDGGPLTLHLDGLHDRAGPHYGFLVRQNPWSAFDPEGLQADALYFADEYSQLSKEGQKGYRDGMKQGSIVAGSTALGVAVSGATDGAAAPLVARGMSPLIAAASSGLAGAEAANTTSNVLNGKPAFQNAGTVGLAGVALGIGGPVQGDSVAAFRAGASATEGGVAVPKVAEPSPPSQNPASSTAAENAAQAKSAVTANEPTVGGGANLENLSPSQRARIQSVADKRNLEISVVGSRAVLSG